MGWFWDSKKSDPVQKLDPSLKEFLEKETTSKYDSPATTPAPAKAPAPPVQAAPEIDPSKPSVPAESLYQDGRYAHLWKNYEPLSNIEAKGKTDSEKLSDLVEDFTARETDLNRVSQENCSMEWLAYQECLKNGGFVKRMTMCKTELNTMSRCFTTQGKMMKAMGYLSPVDRTPERLEDIQIHTDRMYRNMIEQEKAIEEAKKEGRPIPKFPSIMSKTPLESQVDKSMDLTESEWASLPEERARSYRDRLSKLEGTEREIEVTSLRGEMDAARHLGIGYLEVAKLEAERRHARQEAGKATVGDTIKKLWGWK